LVVFSIQSTVFSQQSSVSIIQSALFSQQYSVSSLQFHELE